MKIRELKRVPYFIIEFGSAITFTEEEGEVYQGTFTLKELEELIDVASSFVQDYHRSSKFSGSLQGWHSSKERYSPTNVDTDPPDEYNVFENEDGHACNTTVDGG